MKAFHSSSFVVVVLVVALAGPPPQNVGVLPLLALALADRRRGFRSSMVNYSLLL